MTTTKATTDELLPLEISPLYSDCTIQVPLDDRSGFHTYNLHLCMLYDSPYFEKVVPNSKKVTSIPTLKSHFEIILRYIYNKKQIFYNDDNILDLITEGYRFQLPNFVSRLWSEFASGATALMVIDALKRIENLHEFSEQYDKPSLQAAIKRNLLSVFNMTKKLKKFQSIELIMDVADNQNPDVILKKLQQWSETYKGQGKADAKRSVQNLHDTLVKREKNNELAALQNGVRTQLFSLKNFSKDVRCYKREISTMESLECVIGASTNFTTLSGTLTIQSISPLKVIAQANYYSPFVFRLWDKEGTYYISKEVIRLGETLAGRELDYGIMNAHEWTKGNKLQFEIIKCDSEQVFPNEPKKPVEQPLAFSYPPNREKLTDFIVECQGENGPAVYKLNKFILQQSPHFKRMFSMSSFIEAKTNKAKIETPSHLFEVILRYLYDQEPLKGISSIITDVILEASYFDLSDFENDLWSLFEKEADVTNWIKAVNLIEVNMHFKAREAIVMNIVVKNIKAVLGSITDVLDWKMVSSILDLECTKKQNPLLILKSVKRWCKKHDPKNSEKRIREVFSKIKGNAIPQIVAKELCAKYPYLRRVNVVNSSFKTTETFLLSEGATGSLHGGYMSTVSVSNTGVLNRKGRSGDEIRLHDQLSSYYIVVEYGAELRQVIENIEEWKYGGCYRISVLE